jgi:hypothetical protein
MKIKIIALLSYILFTNTIEASDNWWCCCSRKTLKNTDTRASFSSTESENDVYQFFEENGDQLVITFIANQKDNTNKQNNRQISTNNITMQLVRNVISNTEEIKQNKKST